MKKMSLIFIRFIRGIRVFRGFRLDLRKLPWRRVFLRASLSLNMRRGEAEIFA
jgi:hypothetical protein